MIRLLDTNIIVDIISKRDGYRELKPTISLPAMLRISINRPYPQYYRLTCGVSFGNTYGEPNGMQLVIGGSFGFWSTSWERRGKHWYNNAFGGPLVKLRWRFLEMSYRGLVGAGGYNYFSPNDDDSHYGIAYTSQLMLGVHFQTTRRGR